MIITPSNNAYFVTSVMEPRFWTAFGVAEEWASKIATPYPIEGLQWVSAWMGMLDKYREWLGPRKTRQPAPQTYLVPVKDWELTEEIDEFRLMDSTAATAASYYGPTAAFMGLQGKKLWDYMLGDLLNGIAPWTGTWQNGTDGLTNWNTAHSIDFYDSSKGTYSNDYRGNSGTVVSPGGGLTTNGFATAWQDMSARKSESGEALGITPDLVMAPTSMAVAGKYVIQGRAFAGPQIVQIGSGTGGNAVNVGAVDNPTGGMSDLFVNVDLTVRSTTLWYLLCTKAPIKPFSLLQRLMPDFIPRVSPDDPVVFNEHKILYGSRARGSVAWGLPWLSSISS